MKILANETGVTIEFFGIYFSIGRISLWFAKIISFSQKILFVKMFFRLAKFMFNVGLRLGKLIPEVSKFRIQFPYNM